MKKSKFTEEQIAFTLHQAQTGVSLEKFCLDFAIDPGQCLLQPAQPRCALGTRHVRDEIDLDMGGYVRHLSIDTTAIFFI
jgi:hypothetical protein